MEKETREQIVDLGAGQQMSMLTIARDRSSHQNNKWQEMK